MKTSKVRSFRVYSASPVTISAIFITIIITYNTRHKKTVFKNLSINSTQDIIFLSLLASFME